jgi:ribosome-binding protein aMBF1 (putative translation factor)
MITKRIAIVAVNEDGYRIGQSHHNARISDYAVQCIRDAREERGLSYGKLASMFKLSKSTIQKLCNYERRAQIPRAYKKVTQYLCDQTTSGQAEARPGHAQPQGSGST